MAFTLALFEVAVMSLVVGIADAWLFMSFGVTKIPHVFTFSMAFVALRRVVEMREIQRKAQG